jgi:hypothetical protein
MAGWRTKISHDLPAMSPIRLAGRGEPGVAVVNAGSYDRR